MERSDDVPIDRTQPAEVEGEMENHVRNLA